MFVVHEIVAPLVEMLETETAEMAGVLASREEALIAAATAATGKAHLVAGAQYISYLLC